MGVKTLSLLGQSADLHQYVGHTHFWERAMARRQFLMTTAGALGLALGSGLWRPKLGWAAKPASALPKPIPGGFVGPGGELFHIFDPVPGNEPSTITDFHGFVGVARITGNGIAHPGNRHLFFDTDMRFMKGQYIGVDGRQHNGTFGFI